MDTRFTNLQTNPGPGASLCQIVYRTAGPPPLENVAVTGVNVYRSDPSNIRSLPGACYDLYWTGTTAGTFIVQVSNKATPDVTTDADWKTLALDVPIVQPAGAAGGDYIDLTGCPFRWVRLKYTSASGTGTVSAYLNAKGN